MQSQWNDADAAAMVKIYAAKGVSEDVALRTYTARLLGSNKWLVMHGGGNTSVKTEMRDVYGETVNVLCVKGSGWDLATIEPAGHPAVRIDPLFRLRGLDALSDEDMVNVQRQNMLDSSGPNPSVETLLHTLYPAQIRRSHPFDHVDRHRRSGRCGRAWPEDLGQARRLCALHHAWLRAGESRG